MSKEANELLNFPTELYVGTKNLASFDTTNPPLAFATPNGTDKAFEKRKETVDSWCGNGTERRPRSDASGGWVRDEKGYVIYDTVVVGMTKPQVISNDVISGFSLDRAIERSVTNNKVFRITDPRGFQLEISADNFVDIVLNCKIDKGEILGDFVWGRKGGTNFLTRTDHPSYKEFLTPSFNRSLRPGDHVYLGNKRNELIYCGEFYVFSAREKTISRTYEFPKGRTSTVVYRYSIEKHRDTKPYKVFKDINATYDPYQFGRSSSKVVILSENNSLPDDLPLNGKLLKTSWGCVVSLFDKKADMMAFDAPFSEINKLFGYTEETGVIKYIYEGPV